MRSSPLSGHVRVASEWARPDHLTSRGNGPTSDPSPDRGASPPHPDSSTSRLARMRFPIRIDPRFRWLVLLVFGVREGNAYVDLADDKLVARFGFYGVRTPISNIERWEISGPYRALTAIGVRRAIRHGDVTFGGSAHGGVRVDFYDPPRWFGVFHPPAFYFTVEDLDGLAAELTRRGIPGRDVRKLGASG